jgi:hypothetical protein
MVPSPVAIVPMQAGMLHPGGQQTWVNAMTRGKPMIVEEDRSVCDYIVQSSTDWLAKPGDAAAEFFPWPLAEGLFRVIGESVKEATANLLPGNPSRRELILRHRNILLSADRQSGV